MAKTHDLYSKTYQDIRKELMHFEKNNNHKLGFFRQYTEAFKNSLTDIYVIDKEGQVNSDIPVIFGNQERAVAKIQESKNLTLPIISVTIAGNTPSFDRRKPGFNIITSRLFHRKERRAYRVVSFSPKPVDLVFRVSVYTKYIEDANQITEQIEERFHPSMILKTSDGNSTHVFLESSTDQSALNVADKEDRIIQKAFSMVAQGYISRPKFILASNGKLKPLTLQDLTDFGLTPVDIVPNLEF
jgi:hypothetical protein